MKRITASVLSLMALLALTLSPSLAAPKDACCDHGACCKGGLACCHMHHVK